MRRREKVETNVFFNTFLKKVDTAFGVTLAIIAPV